MPERPASDAERVVFGVVRELVTNVVKHAKAESVLIELALTDDQLVAVVADDGVGFDEESAARRLAAGHIGLASQRLRVEAAGVGSTRPRSSRTVCGWRSRCRPELRHDVRRDRCTGFRARTGPPPPLRRSQRRRGGRHLPGVAAHPVLGR